MVRPSDDAREAAPAPRPGRFRPAALKALSHPVFRAVWIMSLVTNFGGLIQSVGASWTMSTIASAEMVALVQASVTLPIMLLSLTAGAMADTVDRRIIMLSAQSFMLVVSVALAVTTWAGLITPWTLLGFTFLIGCGVAFNGPAWQASVGDMVPREDIPEAVTLNSMGFNLARSVGPAMGGAIVAAFGAAAAFALNAVSYLGLIAVLLRWKPERPPRALARESLGMAMAAGVRYAAMSPRVYAVLLRALVFGVGACSIQALMPLVARETIGGGPLTFGLLLGAFGVGAVGGAFASNRLRRRMSVETLVRGACVAFGLAAVTTAFSPWLALTLVALTVAGAGWVLALSSFNVTVQTSVPRWVVARALALYQMAAFGGMAAGSWIWGVTAEADGLAVALTVSGMVLGVCALIGLQLPLPDASDLKLDPLMRWQEPQTAVAIEPRSGPVVITVEYRIREDDIPDFLEAMGERRRIRRRDGARHWTLLRDLAEPDLWIERYHTPTWVDYVRHHERFTHEDVGVVERLKGLHQGDWPPLVHRRIERQAGPGNAHRERDLVEPMTDATRAS
ncbi:MAG TPA: MFS transporter [Caulobacteraceae bacterium]|nr:MFS transporter [Caulobacteraceae bacterium]